MVKNEKGSTLLMVMVTIIILSVLGTALLMMTTLNVKMKKTDQSMKQTLYYSESGVDQVYAYVGLEVKNALKSGDETAKDNLDVLKATIEADLESKKNDPNHNLDYPEYIKEDGSLNQEKLQDYAKEQFSIGFWDYFNTNNKLSKIEEAINNETFIIKVSEEEDENYDTKAVSITSSANSLTISIESNFQYKGLEKKVTADVVIQDPNGVYPVGVTENLTRIEKNPLWQSALVSMQDFNLSNSTITINGDIFVKGSEVDKGILATNGTMNINNSEIFTDSYIQTGNGGLINIINSEIYCNSLVTPKNCAGAEIEISSTDTTCKGDSKEYSNVYVKDDIELNGIDNKIKIIGNYYGFSDGSSSDTHNKSSCILTNADLSSSSLVIQGHEIVVVGTAYIDPNIENSDVWPYQTGESVSIKGNYRAYAEKFNDGAFKNTLFTEEPLKLGYKFDDNTSFIVFDKIKYFKEYCHTIGTQELDLGNGNIDINIIDKSINDNLDKLYTIGLRVDKNESGDLSISSENINMDIGTAQEVAHSKSLEFDLRSSYLTNNYFTWNNDQGIVYNINESKPEKKTVICINSTENDINLSCSDGKVKLNGTDISDNTTVTGLIISKGNINICGTFTYNGCIIAGGNININDGANVTFNNSEDNHQFIAEAIKKYDLQPLFPKESDEYITVHDIPEITTHADNEILNPTRLMSLENWTHQ